MGMYSWGSRADLDGFASELSTTSLLFVRRETSSIGRCRGSKTWDAVANYVLGPSEDTWSCHAITTLIFH